MNKNIYCISGYIPSDENKVVVTVYYLASIGHLERRFVWINIVYGGGIGTGLDWPKGAYESSEDALISLLKYTDEKMVLLKGTFEEMLSAYEHIRNMLTSKLVTTNPE